MKKFSLKSYTILGAVLLLIMHLFMCSGCRNYLKQNRFLERLLKRHAHTTLAAKQDTTALEAKIMDELHGK